MANEEKSVFKILKWAGIIALVAVPVIMILKKRRSENTYEAVEDDSNIFAAELEE